MRLRELQNLIQTADLGALTLKTENRQPNAITIENLNSLKATIEHLAIAPAFRELCLPILQSSLFGTPLDSYRVGVNEFDGLINPSVNKLKYAAQGVDQAIQGQLAPEKEESMTIKLPDARELRTVANDLERIEKALSQVVNHPSIDGKVEVNTWEPGSLWIEIYLGTMAAVSIVASIAWSAAVISKKRHEAQIIAESVRGLAIKATSLEDLCEAQRSMIELQIESEAKALCADSGSDLDRILRLQFAIKEFASLIDRGAEVHPALMAPESVKNLFPANLNPLAIESKIHRIENSAPSLDE